MLVIVELSPESLSADGMRPQHQRLTLLRKLQMQQRSLFAAFGRPVSEQVARDWYDAKMTAERSRAARESLEADRIFQSGEPVN